MPFVGGDVQPGRKRRWEDGDEGPVYRLYSPEESKDFFVVNKPHPELVELGLPAPRKVLPITTKRARIAADDDSSAPFHGSHNRPQRSSLSRSLSEQQSSASSKAPAKATNALLMPCHICHRRPTKKSDLDSFADCQGCGERTCFVCIRQCPGWNVDEGSVLSEQEVLSRSFHMDDIDDMETQDSSEEYQEHQQQQHHHRHHDEHHNHTKHETRQGWDAGGHRTIVCSRCCIERGIEGDVACLGCLSRMEGT